MSDNWNYQCHLGHSLEDGSPNLYLRITAKGKQRNCRICTKARIAKFRAAKKKAGQNAKR